MIPDFLVPIAVGGIIQLIKLVIDLIEEKKFRLENFWRAGGFPSVHSGISSSITTLMLLKYGIYSPPFTIAFIFSFLFWYDAMNVRFEAGKHATYLNKIGNELRNVLNFTEQFHFLKERLGHDFVEVIGGIIIGSLITLMLYFFLPIVNSIGGI